MHRKTTQIIGNRAKGVAQLMAAGHLQSADNYMQTLTFGLAPNRLEPIFTQLGQLQVAYKKGDHQQIVTIADSLIELAIN